MSAAVTASNSAANLVAGFFATVERAPEQPALSWLLPEGERTTLTWASYGALVIRLASALQALGVRPRDRVGILSENRPEWLLADLGILAAGAVTVAPHAPLSASQVAYQLHDAEVSWLFISTVEQWTKIEQTRAELPHLRGIICLDLPSTLPEVLPWDRFLALGEEDPQRLRSQAEAIRADDLAGILYTSGTTGHPKGVMLTHGNLVSNAQALLQIAQHASDDLLLTWLPFTHIYARTVDHYKSVLGGLHLFLAANSDVVPKLLPVVQPTHMSCVPRFYEKILAAIRSCSPEQVAPRLRALFGPRMKWFSSGGAPLAPEMARFFHQAGMLVLQGYGLTESSPVISFNHPGAYRFESVGQPLPNVEVRIAEDGEILTRGPHVMAGYWKNPAATEAILREGWLHTGDLGNLDADGFLHITGRKKEMLILSNGKKIAPSQIEGLLLADPLLEQVMLVGEGRHFLSALVVPAWPALRQELAAQGQGGLGTDADLAEHPAVHALLHNHIQRALRDLSPAEQIRRFLVLAEPFSVQREELTVSLKLRRNVVYEHYRQRIEALYAGS